MADQRVNGNLILIGTSGGTIALGSQPSGGGFTILLPTTIPQVGQTLVINSVFNGNTATAQWSAPPGITSIAFSAPSIFAVSGTPIISIPGWSAVTNYIAGQSVNFLGLTYTALNTNVNQQPNISPSFWAVTSSGTIILTLATQSPNTFWSGPVSGLAAAPTFRSIVVTDLFGGTGASNTTFLRGDGTWAVPADPDNFVVTVFGRSGPAVIAQSGDYNYSQISGTPQLPVTPIVPSHNWLNGYSSTTGHFSFSQPSVSDLSDGFTGSGVIVLATSPTISGATLSGSVSVTGSLTFTTANPTFFSVTGTGAVVLATSPTITAATLAGTTTATNVHILGTLADGVNSVGTNGQVLTSTHTGVAWANVSSGTVTSVALAAPAEFTVSGSPVTTSGTLTLTKATQNANTVWAGPTFGAAAAPAFRLLVAADIPALPYAPTNNPTFTGTVTLPAVTLNGAMTAVTGASITFSGTGTINANEIYGVVINNTPPTIGQVLTATSPTAASWMTASGTTTFGSITSGTNTIAAMTVGTGASIVATGTGVIEATQIQAVVVSAIAPTTGQLLQATSATTAAWQTFTDPLVQTVRIVYASNPLGAGSLSTSIPVNFSVPFADGNYTAEVSVETAAAMQSATVVATFQKQGTPGNGVNVQVLNNDSLAHTVTVHVIARHD